MIIQAKKTKSGFTLIEMMVAVSIFVIVAFIVVSTLLTMSYAYKKAQKMRLLMDNFNFALQAMSLTIREGVDYKPACDGDRCIKFKPIDSWLEGGNDYICYNFIDGSESEKGYIERCLGDGNLACPCSGNAVRFTSPDIDVDNLSFVINDDGPISQNGLNKVKILISGEAGTAPREKTSFFIQNTVSQRNNNNL